MSLLLLLQAQAAGGAALNQTLGAATLSAAGTLTDSGSLSTGLGSCAISAQGALIVSASSTPTLGAVTLSATGGAPAVIGSLSATLGAATLTAQGALVDAASLAKTLDAATVSATASATVTGTLAGTLGTATLAASGTVAFTAITGTLNQTLDALALSAAGTSDAPIAPAQPSNTGGYLWTPAAERELAQLLRKRKQLQDDEKAIEAALNAAADDLKTIQAQLQADDVQRLAGLVDAFAQSTRDDLLLRRTARAIKYAQRAQSALAYQLAAREIARQLEEEELAVLMALAIAA